MGYQENLKLVYEIDILLSFNNAIAGATEETGIEIIDSKFNISSGFKFRISTLFIDWFSVLLLCISPSNMSAAKTYDDYFQV